MKKEGYSLITALFAALLVLLFAQTALAAGNVSARLHSVGVFRIYIFSWTADSSGDVSDALPYQVNIPSGKVVAFQADPAAGVSADYDVAVGLTGMAMSFANILGTQGTDLSNSTDGQNVVLTSPFIVPGAMRLSLTVSGAGNATSGVFCLIVEQVQ